MQQNGGAGIGYLDGILGPEDCALHHLRHSHGLTRRGTKEMIHCGPAGLKRALGVGGRDGEGSAVVGMGPKR